jgi:hypothetical protein
MTAIEFGIRACMVIQVLGIAAAAFGISMLLTGRWSRP